MDQLVEIVFGIVLTVAITGFFAKVATMQNQINSNKLQLAEIKGELKVVDVKDVGISSRLRKIDDELREMNGYIIEIKEFIAAFKNGH